MDKQIQAKRLTYFTFLWALLAYVEQLLHSNEWFLMPTHWLFMAVTIFALCKPKSLTALVLLVVTSFVQIFLATDNTLNNLTVESLVNFNLIVIFLYYFFNRSKPALDRADIYVMAVPLLRLYVFGIYFFSVLTKLNIDFLDPRISCASVMMDNVYFGYLYQTRLSLPMFAKLKPMLPWLTIIFEFCLPFFLLFRSTRFWAIVIGIVFHMALCVVPWTVIGGITMLMLVLYFVFLSDEEFAGLYSLGEKIRTFIHRIMPSAILRYGLLAGGIILSEYISYLFARNYLEYRRSLSVFICIAVGVFYLVALWLSRRERTPAPSREPLRTWLCPRPWPLVLLILPLIFTGITPFLGIRTTGAVTLFSNLRTVGPYPNHLFIPSSWMIFKPKLVKIVYSKNPAFYMLTGNNSLMTDYEFRILINKTPGDFFVLCEYEGIRTTVYKKDGIRSDHPLLRPVPWIQQKFMRFSFVSGSKHQWCQERVTRPFQ